jgi:drug/metabolite transporter (DMT)-like permease
MRHIPLPVFLLAAALLEAGGDALLRKALLDSAGPARIALFAVGAVVLFSYGIFVNLAPLEFGQVIGLYITTLFVVWQLINFVFFHRPPTLPILVGGVLIVAGGLIVSFWKTA